MAFLGGITPIENNTYKIILGAILLIPAIRFAGFYKIQETKNHKPHSVIYALLIGAAIGYLSGLTGIGGGILLSPILLSLGWTNMKQTAALSAGFIFLNSISGMGGLMIKGIQVNEHMVLFIFIAFLGGIAGSYLGANKFNQVTLSKILGIVLFIASLKLIFA